MKVKMGAKEVFNAINSEAVRKAVRVGMQRALLRAGAFTRARAKKLWNDYAAKQAPMIGEGI